jgi:cyclic-di-GMP phosphodiesterase TipF (flagellum assembly factor)
MVRTGAIFVAVCMVLIAVSIGIVLFAAFGLNGPEATIVAIGALTALALYDAVAKQIRSRSLISDQISNLSRGTADLAWQVGDLTRNMTEFSKRMAAVERKVDHAPDEMRSVIPSFTAEIGELGTIVKQLAEAVAAHEMMIAEQRAITAEQLQMQTQAAPVSALAPAPASAPQAAPRVESGEVVEAETKVVAKSNGYVAPVYPEPMVATIRSILEANHADLYLQPIVTLPQRKVRYYEALTRLRSEDGTLLLPADFLKTAESAGLIAKIDHLALSRAAQLARRLLQKNRDIGIICNISPYTLLNTESREQLRQFIDANQELASALVLEFPQSTWRSMGEIEQACILALRALGVRFSMDHVQDLHMEPRELADRGIRLVKVPAKLLLELADPRAFDIHPADLSDLLARFGVSLIAERVESETTVIDLLEYEVRFGQGFLFAPPRPVRAEALADVTEEKAATAREPAKRPAQPAAAQSAIANVVEEIRRTSILPQPLPDGSRA